MSSIPLTLKTKNETAISTDVSSERLVNCFPSIRPENPLGPMQIIGSWGESEFGTGASGTGARGSIANNDGTEGWVVFGNTLYSVDTGGTKTSRGTLNTSTGRVWMAVGEFYLMITDGTDGYTLDFATDTLATISDPQFVDTPTVVDVLDGYFCVVGYVSGASVVALSDIDDPTSWTTVNIGAAESVSDSLTSLVAINRELWLLGSTTCEVKVNSRGASATDFPLSYSYSHSFGIAAASSVVRLNGYAYWLARTASCKAQLVRAQGSSVEIVNNEDMNRLFQSFSTVSDAYFFPVSDAGQSFIVMVFPTVDQTWVYCVDTNYFFKAEQSDATRPIWNTYMFLNNKHIVGSRSANRLYQLSLSTYTEASGNPVKRKIITPTLFDKDNYIAISRLRLYLDSSSFASAQTFTLEASGDGGDTYRTALTNSVTQNRDYALFTRISASRRLTMRITFNAAYEFIILNCMALIKTRGR